MKRLLTFLLAIAAGAQLCPAQMRTFTSAENGAKIEGRILKVSGNQVTLVLANGVSYPNVDISKFSQADQEFIRAWKPTPGAAGAAPQDRSGLPAKDINDLLGIPLFSDNSLWRESTAEVAKRLGWPRESKTTTQSSYRRYFLGKEESARIARVRPYSAVLYGRDGYVDYLSIVFANKGDSVPEGAKGAAAIKAIEEAISRDGKVLSETLAPLGKPEWQSSGSGEMRERQLRWDWRGHAILLTEEEGEYLGLRVMPSELADRKGRPERTKYAEVKEAALKNIATNDMGDTYIENIPMVNQGPKGYCVPATLERYLRYMNIRADMYLLAMAGGTQAGGGTSVSAMIGSTERFVRRAGRSFKNVDDEVSVRFVKRYIKKGLPLMWTMTSTKPYNDLAFKVTKEREQFDNARDWSTALKKLETDLSRNLKEAHLCMIVGYNEKTDEIAVSDSWGDRYQLRWVPADQAQQVSLNQLYIIEF